VWDNVRTQPKLDRIGVMSLCLRRHPQERLLPADPKRTVDIMRSPICWPNATASIAWNFQQTDFDSTEPGYFQEFRRRVERAKSKVNQINLEFAKSEHFRDGPGGSGWKRSN